MPQADPMLATDIAGLMLRSPVILAAGTAGTLGEMAEVLDEGLNRQLLGDLVRTQCLSAALQTCYLNTQYFCGAWPQH